jgi:2'-5' RNA ligase
MLYSYRQENEANRERNRFAVVSFLPKHLDDIIAPLREKFDPDYNVIPSHLTLATPFETDRSLDEIAGIVYGETARVESAGMRLRSIGDYYPNCPLIYWGVEADEGLNRLYLNLMARLDLVLPCKGFAPHVTVAKEISIDRVLMIKEQIVPYLPDETLKIETVDLVSPVAGANWVSVRTFRLGERTREY